MGVLVLSAIGELLTAGAILQVELDTITFTVMQPKAILDLITIGTRDFLAITIPIPDHVATWIGLER